MSDLRWKSLAQFRIEINQQLSKEAKRLLTNSDLARAGPKFSEEATMINRAREEFSTMISNSRVARLEKNIRSGYPINDDVMQEIIEGTGKEKKKIINWLEDKTKKLIPVLEKIKKEEKERKKRDQEVKDEMEREKEEFEKKFG